MLATDILENEHEQILKVVGLLEKATDRLVSDQAVPAEVFEKIASFISNYSEDIHLAKEEELLLKIIELTPRPEEATAQTMIAEATVSAIYTEHEKLGSDLKALIGAISSFKNEDRGAKIYTVASSKNLASFLKEHIRKEDDELFPLANTLLSEDMKKELLEKFRAIDKKRDSASYLKIIPEIKSLF